MGDCCIVYSARGFFKVLVSCCVWLEGATPKLDKCNEVGSQLPHRAHSSRASCLKKRASEQTFCSLAYVCKMRWTPAYVVLLEIVLNVSGMIPIRLLLLIR